MLESIPFESILPFLIACPLVFIAGAVDAIAGGGGLIALPAYFMAGLPVHTALGTSKLSSCMGTTLATYRFAKQGYIKAKRALPCVIAAIIGAWIGANIALLISDDILRIVMMIIIPLTALYLLRSHAMEITTQSPTSLNNIVLCAAIALSLGAYDGFYGPGTGTFLMLAFSGIAHLHLHDAAGTTKAVNLATNLSALAVFLISGQVWLLLGIVAGLFNMAGAWIGVKLFTNKGTRVVKPLMLTVLAIFLIKTIVEVFGG